MPIEIVAIGNEVLRGMVVNTNSAYLGRRLDEEGWKTERQTTLPDDRSALTIGLKECLDRSSVVIATGGIGPTLDDITAECATSLFTTAPTLLPNPVGAASGLYFRDVHRSLFLLPGVPSEMEAMFEEAVIPILKQLIPVKVTDYRSKLHFALLKEDDVDPWLRQLQEESSIEAGIYPGYGNLTVVLRGEHRENVEKAESLLKRQFQSHFYESTSGTLEEAIQNWMVEHQKTMACTESCTGGTLAAHLTAIPGSSNYFLGSLVTYSNRLKEQLLHVSNQTLETKGAVSLETVKEMWEGVIQATGADFGVAISGIAGPSGGTASKPVGTVHYALGFKSMNPDIGTLHFKGGRSVVILRTTKMILGLIWKKLR